MKVTGGVSLSAPLPADLALTDMLEHPDIGPSLLDFSFSDGRQTFSELGVLSVRSVETDAAGAITRWRVELGVLAGDPLALGDRSLQILSSFTETRIEVGSTAECVLGVDSCRRFARGIGGKVGGVGGAWTRVPEPFAALLLGPGLLGMALER